MKSLHRFLVSIVVSTILLISIVSQPGQAAFQALPTSSYNLYETLTQKAIQKGSVRVIVSLNVPFEPEGRITSPNAVNSQRAAIQNAQASLLQKLDKSQISDVKRLQHQPTLALSVSPQALEALKSAPEVRSIREDKLSKPTLGESVSLIGARPDQTYGFSGLNWTVAILDTGVDKTHSMFAGKVVSEACYSTNDASYGSSSVCPGGVEQSIETGSGVQCSFGGSCNHGTHVAGIAAGKGSSTFGVARDATIISIQVFSRFDSTADCDGAAPCAMSWDSDILLGLERVYHLAGSYNIAAANLSLGGGYYTSTQTCDSDSPYLKEAIDNLRSIKVATVIASGNEAYTNGLSSPGCISSAISVGSTKDGSNGATPVDTVSNFSNSASFLTLLAPGEWIYSSVPGNTYQTYSGTSMAAPHVAGAFAILKSSNPQATVDELASALINTGKLVTDTRNNITKPRIFVISAIDQLGTALPSITSFTPTSVSFGKTVVISGLNFTGATSVKFNTSEAEFKVNSSTQITAIVPNGAAAGYIYVTTPSGTARSTTTYSLQAVTDLYTLIRPGLKGLNQSTAAWGDYDQDGDLDLLMTGLDGSTPVSKIYRNDGQNTFTDIQANLPGVYKGSSVWMDDDRDGDLDILLSGQDTTAARTEIFRNDGSGNFSPGNAGLTPLSDSAAAWGDYDNDGDLDLLTAGLDGGTPKTILYRNDRGTYNSAATNFIGLYHGSTDWGDFDNDGDQDILLTGFDGTTAYTKVYKNNGDLTFTEFSQSLTGVYGGSALWSDYDNDADLDFLMTGKSSYGNQTSIYRNMGSTFSSVTTDYADYDESAGAWVDFDNDGDLDFVVTGGSSSPAIMFYRNVSTSVTTNIIGMSGGAMAWGDYDKDSDLDLVITGSTSIGPATQLYRNETVNTNTPPAAPTNPSATVLAGGRVNLSWSFPLDTQTISTGLYYNLRMGTTPGGIDIISPDSDLNSGYRRLPSFGNAWKGTTAALKNLPPGDYYWSVQAIDSALAGSPFSSEGTFKILPEVYIDHPTYSIGEEGGRLSVNISLTAPVQEQVTVEYATTNETALAGSDYIPSSGQLIFAPGQTTQPVEIEILEDWMSETNETFTITLFNASINASLGDPKQTKVTILDNDGFADAGITLMTGYNGSEYEGISRAWGDFDNDNDLDIVSEGTNDHHYTGATFSTIHQNNGDGTFTNLGQSGLTAVDGGYLEWGDFDNDADLDILLLGSTSTYSPIARIYRNNGNATFTDINAGLVGVMGASGAWGDYDNDGDLDVVINGHVSNAGGPATRLYRNNGNATFTDMILPFRNLTQGSLDWGDYDNDNDLDLLLTGADNYSTTGRPVTLIERNNGNGTFTEFNPGLDNVAYGTAAWGDYDSDGDLDILLTGCLDSSCATSISKIYRNNGNGNFTNINASLPASYWKTYASSADPDRRLSSWGDYDNDGDLDILMSGIRTAPITRVFRNDGGNVFTDTQDNIFEGDSGPTAWGDYDNDGDLDIITLNGRIYRNKMLSHNSVPTAPTGLATSISGSTVNLQWNAANDNQTPSPGLTYNLIVGTYSHGENIQSPLANKNTGYRRVPAFGSANHGTSAALKNLLAGTTYYWSVQAVDSAFAGSPFAAEGTFTTPNPIITLASSAVTIAEDQAAVSLQVSLSGPSQKTITVKYQTSGGTATENSDYIPASGTLTFNPGQTVRTISLNVLNDTQDEPDETFNLVLSDPTNATIGAPGTTTVTISDNDGVPTIGFTASTFTATENQGSVDIGIVLSSPSGKVITVQFATGNGSATSGQDYLLLNQVVTFNPGETSKTVTLQLLDDTLEESDETVSLNLSSAVNASLVSSTAVLTIHDYEPPVAVQFSQSAISIAEDQDAATMIVTLSRSTQSVVTVQYQTSNGTATANEDYTPTSGTLTFQPGQTSKSFIVPVLTDDLDEPDETVQLALSNPTNAVLGSQKTAVITIRSINPPPPTITLTSGTMTVGEDQSTASLQVSLSASSSKTITVKYQASGGTAAANSDYVPASGTLTFNPGQTVQTVSVSLIGDALDEMDETFNLVLSDPTNATIGTHGTTVVTIQDNDAQPAVSFANGAYSAAENEGPVEIGITLSSPSAKVVTVQCAAGTGSATIGQDYVSLNQVVTFNPGETSKTVALQLLDDPDEESDETVSLMLSGAVNATLTSPTTVVTIHDYEPPVEVEFIQSDFNVDEVQGSASVTVTLSRATQSVVTVRIKTGDGTATAGEDYESVNTILTFLPGETSQSINVLVLKDDVEEPDETITLDLSEPTNAVLTSQPNAVITVKSIEIKYKIYLPAAVRAN